MSLRLGSDRAFYPQKATDTEVAFSFPWCRTLHYRSLPCEFLVCLNNCPAENLHNNTLWLLIPTPSGINHNTSIITLFITWLFEIILFNLTMKIRQGILVCTILDCVQSADDVLPLFINFSIYCPLLPFGGFFFLKFALYLCYGVYGGRMDSSHFVLFIILPRTDFRRYKQTLSHYLSL